MIIDSATGEVADLHALYRWPRAQWVSGLMLSTLGQAVAGPDGGSRSVSSPDDRAVMSALRDGADAVLVGAGTVRAERYGPMRAREHASRVTTNASPAPTAVIVTESGDIPWDTGLLTDSDNTPIIATTTGVAEHLTRQSCPATVLDCGLASVSLAELRGQLMALGLGRILCEGGPRLMRTLASADLFDELNLSWNLASALPGTGILGADADMDLRRFAVVHLATSVDEEAPMAFARFHRAG